MADHSVPSNGAHSSLHASLRTLRGTQPGLLDPSQPSRLLRSPDSKLSFASFDPKTALPEEHATPNFNNPGGITPPKRIVIETTSKGASFWRFVPRARLEEGAHDEGIWPRVIDVCGEKVQCYQEQWEMYKLDPRYLCVVYPWSRCSAISRVELQDQGFEDADPNSGKRSRWSSPETTEPPGQKKARSRPPDGMPNAYFDSDEDEVEEMIIDESFTHRPRSQAGRGLDPTNREKLRKARLDRWAKNRTTNGKQFQETTFPAHADGSFSMRVDSDVAFPSQSTPWPLEENIKRKGDPSSESENDSDRMSYDRSPHGHKKARTLSPEAHKDSRNSRVRQKRRLDRLRQLNRHHQQTRFAEYLGSTFAPPEPVSEEEEDEPRADTTETCSQETDDASLGTCCSRENDIAESIRKLRELEKDRPLWEEARRKREAHERAEEEERLAKAERWRKEEEQRQRQQREADEQAKRLAQREAERRAQEEEHRQHEARQRRQRQRWESGPWTTHRALERYRMLSDEFDAAKFTSGQSITFHDIPWPVLHAPSRLTVEDVDWTAVETFFAAVKSHMRLQDYKEFVEKSHRRFHPDRWRARKIWAAVTNEVERGYLEVAANTVAQALTPIWRGAKEK